MVQIQLGDDVRLRIIGSATCISNSPEPNRSTRSIAERSLPPDTRLQIDEKLQQDDVVHLIREIGN
jgi:hypothetical protein